MTLGLDNACIIKAKDIWRSVIYARMNSVDPALKMPPLARSLVDTNAVQLFNDWINSLPGIPALAPPVITPNGGTSLIPGYSGKGGGAETTYGAPCSFVAAKHVGPDLGYPLHDPTQRPRYLVTGRHR